MRKNVEDLKPGDRLTMNTIPVDVEVISVTDNKNPGAYEGNKVLTCRVLSRPAPGTQVSVTVGEKVSIKVTP